LTKKLKDDNIIALKGAEIMRKTFTIEDLDCAHCAAKMEEKIKGINGVINANVNFIAQKLTIEAQDDVFDEVVEKAAAICKEVEPDCTVEF
jgi:copper chaperone CopZ